MKLLDFGLAILQLSDIGLHAATNQFEPLRVLSNISILLWLALAASGKFKQKSLMVAAVSFLAYLGLNVAFLVKVGPVAVGGAYE